MAIVVVAMTLVGMLCAVNLILTVGVIKRLREHSGLLSGMSGPPTIPVGKEIGGFLTSTVDGELLSDGLMSDDSLVAFFSPGCGPCKTTVPAFVEYARKLPGGRDRLLAVVVGDPDEAAGFVGDLNPVTRVVVENAEGALSTAFKTKAYPTLVRVGTRADGRLVVTANDVNLGHPVTTA
ncbi:hypothetical protein [Streptosporangium sp. NPDC002721]|uniref:hypothetical protein n=1 Tax=Streptosporangium sp. NPDC002721 TaxID=3366188 RepID=UPI0036D00564